MHELYATGKKCISDFISLLGNCCLLDHMYTLFFMYQDDTSTVDFILISQPSKSDGSGISDPQHLFSHHACHCRQDIHNFNCDSEANTNYHFLIFFFLFHVCPCLQYIEFKSNNVASGQTSGCAS